MENKIVFWREIITTGLQLGGVIFIVVAWARGWFKGFKKFTEFASKANCFMDELLPDFLEYLCTTDRAPKDFLTKWTKLISTGAVKRSSPLAITDKGRELITMIGLDRVFESNKENWANRVKDSLGKGLKDGKTNKYDVEEISMNVVMKLFTEGDSCFDSIKNYMFENPEKIRKSDLCLLASLLLRDYIFREHSDWIN